jgi:DMSO/TMAO reductase YedYZ molybdopterin-dependent catalytic subunit
LNEEILPINNGAHRRLRVERQLGYKMAKYVMRLEIVEDTSKIVRGKGGYWERPRIRMVCWDIKLTKADK